ncbi:hypothetical protein KYE_08493 [Marinobacter manganoxydans MnI7-9]|uniref:Uncharacterized protein n=1 Tax=Marinobacter manganoxydans MnI7-9 TaxID=1094979 RepID=G6YS64_9GAMM|nr:hypothetical protein KYE_08493 [Marinobacter manganoxydans MnI7-9]
MQEGDLESQNVLRVRALIDSLGEKARERSEPHSLD